MTNLDERNFYEIESLDNAWSLRELKRQFNSGLFERLALSRDKSSVKELATKGQVVQSVDDLIKDPYILEFVGLPELASYSESELEQKLIDKLELGNGYIIGIMRYIDIIWEKMAKTKKQIITLENMRDIFD